MAHLPRKLRIIVHALGLSSVGSALFLQTTVFAGIARNGYFRGIENNNFVLWTEIGLTSIAIAYFGYLLIRFIYVND